MRTQTPGGSELRPVRQQRAINLWALVLRVNSGWQQAWHGWQVYACYFATKITHLVYSGQRR